MSVLHFEGNGVTLAMLLEQHEMLHKEVARFDADGEGGHTREEHEQLSLQIRDNVAKILDLLGLTGVRGLIHVAHEALDAACHRGLNLTEDGEFAEAVDGEAWMDVLSDINEIERLLVATSQHGGRLPADHGESIVSMLGLIPPD